MWLLSYLNNDLGLSRGAVEHVWSQLPDERVDYEITQQLKLEYGRVAMNEHHFRDKFLARMLECSGHVMVVNTIWSVTRQCFFNVQSLSGGYCYQFKHMNEKNRAWEIVTKKEWHHYAHAMLKMCSIVQDILSYLENRYGWWMTQIVHDKLFRTSVLDCSIGRIHGTMLDPPYTGFLFISNGRKKTRFAFQRSKTHGEWQYLNDGVAVTLKDVKEGVALEIAAALENWSDVIRYPNGRLGSAYIRTNTAALLQTLKREQMMTEKSRHRDASPVRPLIN